MVIVSVATCLALWIVGIKYAILLGLITGLFNIIPYIGIFTATLLSVLVTFATAGATKLLLVIATTLASISSIRMSCYRDRGFEGCDQCIYNRTWRHHRPSVWGIPGTFLAIPIIAIAKIVFDRIEPLKPLGIPVWRRAG